MIVRAELAREFMFGDDVVLLAMDGAGAAAFAAALNDALLHGESRFVQGAVVHEFLIQPGDSAIEFEDHRVLWRLTPDTAREIAEDLATLGSNGKPGHHYVDIAAPADTLVLSRDEYV